MKEFVTDFPNTRIGYLNPTQKSNQINIYKLLYINES